MLNKGYCYKKKPSRGLARTYLSINGGETDDFRRAKKVTEEEYNAKYSNDWYFQLESGFTDDDAQDDFIFPHIEF